MTDIKRLLTDKDFQSFKPYIDSGYSNPPKSNVTARWETLREVLPGYKEGVVEIEETAPANDGTGGNRIYTYHINLLTDGKKIFYYTFQLKKFNKIDEDNWESYYSTIDSFDSVNRYSEFENTFRETYNADIIKSDLFQTIVYGGGCGIAGTPTEYQEILDTYLQKKDTKSILVWLKSANTEKQLYAIKGLKVLTKGGYSPTLEENKLITLVRQKEGIVNTCSGCIYSSNTIKNIIAEIDSWDGEYYIHRKRPSKNNNIIYYGLAGFILISLLSFIYLKRRTKKGGVQQSVLRQQGATNKSSS